MPSSEAAYNKKYFEKGKETMCLYKTLNAFMHNNFTYIHLNNKLYFHCNAVVCSH